MKTLTLQVFAQSKWLDAATITTQDQTKSWQSPLDIKYSKDFIQCHFGRADQFALSSHHPVDFYLKDEQQWPAFLLDVLPQGYGKRRLLQDWPNSSTASDDWYALSIGTANPIGNLRIKEASEHWATHLADVAQKYSNGFSLQAIAGAEPEFLECLVSCHYGVAGSSGLQGECPKYLITERQDGRFFIDGTIGDEQVKHSYILKQPKTVNNERDAFILMQEAAYLNFAKAIGLKVGEPIQAFSGGILIPRFDRVVRDGRMERIAQESLLTLMDKTGYGIAFYHQEAVLAMQEKCTNAHLDIAEYLLRDMANMALGNRDNHGRNTAFHRYDHHVGISPLFDFAPMYLDQDGIARSATWLHFEKFGVVNYEQVIKWLFDEVDCLKENKSEFLVAMSPVLEQLADAKSIAQRSGIHGDILRQRKDDLARTQETAALLNEQLVALCQTGGLSFG
jgi:serine/threonine-protein kinase HipA